MSTLWSFIVHKLIFRHIWEIRGHKDIQRDWYWMKIAEIVRKKKQEEQSNNVITRAQGYRVAQKLVPHQLPQFSFVWTLYLVTFDDGRVISLYTFLNLASRADSTHHFLLSTYRKVEKRTFIYYIKAGSLQFRWIFSTKENRRIFYQLLRSLVHHLMSTDEKNSTEL